MESFVHILTNIVILFGIISMISLFHVEPSKTKPHKQALIGIVIGITTILLMVNSWQMSEGIFFDSRTILISVTAVYFGPIVSVIATLIALGFRIYSGGAGTLAGTLTIFSAFAVGFIYRAYLKKHHQTKILNLYFFGLIVHVIMLLCLLALPYPSNIEVLRAISLIILLFYPVATLLLAKVIELYYTRIRFQEIIATNEKKYRELFENNSIGIIQYDTSGTIELVNQTFSNMLKTTKQRLIGLKMLDLPNSGIVEALQHSLAGTADYYEGQYTSVLSGHTFPTRVQFSPLFDDSQTVTGGIAIIEDLSKEVESSQKIRELTNYDSQTRLLNRTSFDNFMFRYKRDFINPFSIALFDINTLHIINTTFGYEEGNNLIKAISDILIETTSDKPYYTPYRIGGDEFAVVMLNTSDNEATAWTKNMQETIEQINTFEFNISLTSGVYTAQTSDANVQEVFSKALDILGANKIYAKSSISTKTVDVIMSTLFAKSVREQLHSERVSQIALLIAQEFHLGTAFNNRVELAGRLHDIGKITMDTTILDKPGPLTIHERKTMETHSLSGFRILSVVSEYLDIANIVYSHHEKIDGTGYPRQLTGHNIPLEARIIAVADAFDAMVEPRPYRGIITPLEALHELKRCSGTQFDPEVVEKFADILPQIDKPE